MAKGCRPSYRAAVDKGYRGTVHRQKIIEYFKLNNIAFNIFAGDATNDAINQNRVEFLNTMRPYLEKTVSKIFLDTANKIVAPIPFDEILPKV